MLRDKLPTPATLLLPRVMQEAHKPLLARQQRQKKYFDYGTRAQPPLKMGDPVRVQLGRKWSPAIVTEKQKAPCSF